MLGQLVSFVGFKSSGKNTAAVPLIEQHNFRSISFADALKDSLAAIFCWRRDLLEGITSESRAWREQVDAWWATKLEIPHLTPRWAMENFGTQIMRRHFHQDIWVMNVERRIIDSQQPVVVIDARFPNEIALIRRFGGSVIRITRGPDPAWLDIAQRANRGDAECRRILTEEIGIHESEWGWLSTPVDHVIANNQTITDLHAKISEFISS